MEENKTLPEVEAMASTEPEVSANSADTEAPLDKNLRLRGGFYYLPFR